MYFGFYACILATTLFLLLRKGKEAVAEKDSAPIKLSDEQIIEMTRPTLEVMDRIKKNSVDRLLDYTLEDLDDGV